MEQEKIYIEPFGDAEKEALKRLSAHALPDEPARHGMKAAAVKAAFWKPFVEENHSVIGLFNKLINTLNELLAKRDDANLTSISELEKADEELEQALNDHENAIAALHTSLGNSDDIDYNVETGTLGLSERVWEDVATQNKAGMMSATDKTKLDTLVELLGDVEKGTSGNETVDRIREVLDVFRDYSEETALVDALARKLNKVTDTGENDRVYAVDSQGEQKMLVLNVQAGYGANSVVEGANSKVVAPDDTTDLNVGIEALGKELPYENGLTEDLTKTPGANSHAEGNAALAIGRDAHAEGKKSTAYGKTSHAEGMNTLAQGSRSHTEGASTVTGVDAYAAHAEGNMTIALAPGAHSEGGKTVASGETAHAEGYDTTASGKRSHAEGQGTLAKGDYSHAEGFRNDPWSPEHNGSFYPTGAIGPYSHAGGYNTSAFGDSSTAIGTKTAALGKHSFAGGYGTIATEPFQTVLGAYNETDRDALFLLGNGTSTNRKNVFGVRKDGRAFVGADPVDEHDAVNLLTLNKSLETLIAYIDEKIEGLKSNTGDTVSGGINLLHTCTNNTVEGEVVCTYEDISTGKFIIVSLDAVIESDHGTIEPVIYTWLVSCEILNSINEPSWYTGTTQCSKFTQSGTIECAYATCTIDREGNCVRFSIPMEFEGNISCTSSKITVEVYG